jgi:lipopolysaccharide/colanic/teichoic acid biosynthesis glycosyltransferase
VGTFLVWSRLLRARVYASSKRLLDIVVALVVLVVTSPVSLVVAAVIAVTMGRPVLFRQQRPGRSGELFELVKFRTMRDGDGSDAERLTALGRFLRSTSLDELPELWNVVRGEMSLVGPRPLLPQYLTLYTERQARRHDVRPGVTGLAQVSGRNAIDWDERLELDVRYVEDASLVLDLRILGQTAASVLRRDGISAEGDATMPVFTGSASSVGATATPVSETVEVGR